MSLWGRMVSAYQGARYGWAGGDLRSLVPRSDRSYGDYRARLGRYSLAESYRNNTVYDSLDTHAAWVKSDERLYKFIRGIYNPVERSTALLESYVYQGTINRDDLHSGALPLVYKNDALEEPLGLIIQWSNLDQLLTPYVGGAAIKGDAFWWIEDDRDRQRIRLTLLDPEKVVDRVIDGAGNVKRVLIEEERSDPPTADDYRPTKSGMQVRERKPWIWTLDASQEEFIEYRDGEVIARYPNDYGFVPLKQAVFSMGKDGWGKNSFFGTPRRKIDELNDQASIINDSIRNVVIPLLQASGVTNASEIQITREDKDSIAILYLSNKDGKIGAVTIPLDIAGATKNRDDGLHEVERDLPELKLQRIADFAGNASGVAIQRLVGDSEGRIKGVRKNLDPALAAALQMGITMGAVSGYDGFGAFNADSFDRGDMDLSIADRAVVPDTLSTEQKMLALNGVKDDPPAVARIRLRWMNLGNSEIDEIVAELEANREQARADAQRQLAARNGGAEDEEGDDDVLAPLFQNSRARPQLPAVTGNGNGA